MHPQRRKILLYAAGAGVLLAILLLARRGAGGGGQQPPADQSQLVPVQNPAPTAGSVDNTGQLADFESSLLNTLPDTISNAIAGGFANQPPPTSSGDGSTTAPAAAPDPLAPIIGAITGLITAVGTGHAGEQTGSGGKKGGAGKPKTRPTPPAGRRGYQRRYIGGKWVYVSIGTPPVVGGKTGSKSPVKKK